MSGPACHLAPRAPTSLHAVIHPSWTPCMLLTSMSRLANFIPARPADRHDAKQCRQESRVGKRREQRIAMQVGRQSGRQVRPIDFDLV